MGAAVSVQIDDPTRADILALLEAHLTFVRAVTPRGSGHALDVSLLCGPEIAFWSARRTNVPVGCVALRRFGETLGEVKSLHVRETHRGQGIAEALMAALEATARDWALTELRLETGSNAAFAPSRAVYRRLGFAPCAPWGDYVTDPFSYCMGKAV
ncbi:MAG: GNAT family N-acetyltransferase [Maricaulaceae bacterium]